MRCSFKVTRVLCGEQVRAVIHLVLVLRSVATALMINDQCAFICIYVRLAS